MNKYYQVTNIMHMETHLQQLTQNISYSIHVLNAILMIKQQIKITDFFSIFSSFIYV